MEGKNRISVLFSKYVANEATKAEVLEFLELVKSEDASSDLNAEMETLWNNQVAVPEHEVDWQRIQNMTMASDIEVQPVRTNRTLWLGIAAALIAVCSLGLWLGLSSNKSGVATYVSGKAVAGKTLTVYLSDGTKVILNSGSELRYPEKFNGDKREVYLNGEAYFEVAHQNKHSFLVHSGKVLTSVLGTSFNIMAYPEMSKMSVTVLTGKVAVKNTVNSKLVNLMPHQRASLGSTDDLFSVDVVDDLTDMISWSKGELIFNKATLEEIALKASKRFGVSIDIVNAEKKQSRITGTFNNQSLNEILHAITQLTQTQFKQNKDKFIIF